MKISVIMPVFNGAHCVLAAIESVRAQTLRPTEFLVVNDGSTDRTSDVLNRFGSSIQEISQAHAGPAAARNTGIGSARCDTLAFLDCDDLWPLDRLATMAEILVENPSADIVAGLAQFRDERGVRSSTPRGSLATAHRPWLLPSLLIRREVFDRLGPLNQSYRWAQDVDWYLRAREHGVRYVMLDSVVVIVRLHETNHSRYVNASRLQLLGALKDALDRRRQGCKFQ